jgi:hypothetical protein
MIERRQSAAVGLQQALAMRRRIGVMGMICSLRPVVVDRTETHCFPGGFSCRRFSLAVFRLRRRWSLPVGSIYITSRPSLVAFVFQHRCNGAGCGAGIDILLVCFDDDKRFILAPYISGFLSQSPVSTSAIDSPTEGTTAPLGLRKVCATNCSFALSCDCCENPSRTRDANAKTPFSGKRRERLH